MPVFNGRGKGRNIGTKWEEKNTEMGMRSVGRNGPENELGQGVETLGPQKVWENVRRVDEDAWGSCG